MPDVTKRCACCGASYSAEGWAALPDAKRWELPWGEVHEQRRCPCGSHLCVVVVAEDPGPGTVASVA